MSANVAIGAEERSDRAAVAVLRPQLAAIVENLDGAISGEDSERLHDLRVAVRRTRTVQRQLEAALPEQPLARFRYGFRWLQRTTGDARDLDVHVVGFDALREFVAPVSRPALDSVLVLLQRRRTRARAEMAPALRSARCTALLVRWDGLLDELEQGVDRRGEMPIGALSDVRISMLYAQIVKLGSSIDPSSPPEAYHELRKQGKELRYLLELFAAPLHSREIVTPMVKSLKALQDTLGRHQDREVQIGTLQRLRGSITTLAGGSGAVSAVDELVDRLYKDELAARAQFRERFDAFTSSAQRRLVADTFV